MRPKLIRELLGDPRRMVIYAIRNRVNGKPYVGQTTQSLGQRLRRYLWPATTKTTMPVVHALRKYGAENFEVSVVAMCSSQKELDDEEIYWANKLNSFSPNGYNLRAGNGPGSMSEETKKRIAASNRGQKRSPETCRRLSISHQGQKWSEEQRQKASAFMKGKQLPAKARRNAIMANQITFELISPSGKLRRFVNLTAFCRRNGYTIGRVSELLNGKRNSYRGWKRSKVAA